MNRHQYLALNEPQISQLENHYDYLPLEMTITNVRESLNKHALKNTLRRQRLRQKMRETEIKLARNIK